MRYIDKLKAMDEVDYLFLLEAIEQDAKKAKCDISAPYDWEITSQEAVELVPNAEPILWIYGTLTQETQGDEAACLFGTDSHGNKSNEVVWLPGIAELRTQSEDDPAWLHDTEENRTQSEDEPVWHHGENRTHRTQSDEVTDISQSD
ncbi:hypothetical protein ANCCAN_09775 [Ancylostoma caninum]|uniref:Uncharacterized protein n=1 Tax=Ancylostoma caninum TaxID=29170 RepID=A0A368GMX1_ANCCA|nr:hypothetical protein ANCCAN_09775 [Ancylostoma caninum]